MKSLIRNEDGAIAIVVALAMVMLVGFSSIVIDYGYIASEKRSLQNAVDAAALAAAQDLPGNTASAQAAAQSYAGKNGVVGSVSVAFSQANKKVSVSATESVEYNFARALLGSAGTTITAQAAAAVTNVFGGYDYALFSGSEIDLLQFTGSNTIKGDVHSNYNIKNAATIDGTVTAHGTIDSKINATGGKISGYPVMDMPDFKNVVNKATVLSYDNLIAAGATYKNGKYSLSADQLNTLLSSFSTLLYVDGDVVVNGSGVSTSGCMIVSGDITFNGGDVDMASTSSVVLCSLNGDITFNGGKGDVNGMLYAPNGTVSLNGNSGVLYGSVIADAIDSNGGVTLEYKSDVHSSLPYTEIRLVE